MKGNGVSKILWGRKCCGFAFPLVSVKYSFNFKEAYFLRIVDTCQYGVASAAGQAYKSATQRSLIA
jgi:hypothetical protein